MNKLVIYIFTLLSFKLYGQSTSNPAPYCNGTYSSGQCNQPGPSNTPGNGVNDFINSFNTTGGNTNITNNNSGCNGNPNNYINYCLHYLQVNPGQVITCNVQSGIIYSQGFAIFVDWNQDNTFNVPSEQVAATPGVPAAASWNVLTFTIPSGTPNGSYRMRVRCSFSTAGTGITPCGGYTFGETEDYTIYVGPIPPSSGVVTATATANSPLCGGQTLSLNVVSSSVANYTWTGPSGFISNLQSPVINNTTAQMSGIYTVVTDGSCPGSATVAVSIAPNAGFTLSPSAPTMCQGNNFTASAVFTTAVNPTQFSYTWSASAPPGSFMPGGSSTGIVSQNAQSTMIFPGLINGSQVVIEYTVVVTPTLLSCPVTKIMTLTINNPLTPTLNLPGAQCNSFPSIQLTASPGGGTWTAPSNTNLISLTGLLQPNAVTSAFGTQTLFYSASVGTCIVSNSGTIAVSKYISPALTSSISTLCIQDPAVNLMSIVQNTQTGVWYGIGVSGSSGNYLFTPSNTPAGYGQVSFPLTYSTQSIPDPTVCPAFTILAVPIFNPPIPVINPIAPRCNNSGPVQLTANPTGSPLWTGNNAVSSTGVLNPNVISNGGTQTVFYSAGQGTCTATGSQTFHISIFHTAALTGTIPNLCVSNNPFNLMSIVQDNNGVWSGQHIIGTSSSAYAFDPGGLMPPNWSTYVLGYYNPSTPDTQLCPDSRTIAVSVSNPPSPNISPAGPFCSVDGTVQLSVNPNIGIWTASSYLTQQGMFTPSLSPLGTNNAVQYVIGTSTCNAQQTAFISVEAFVSSSITTSQLPDQCNTGIPLSLLPMTLNNSGVWSGPGVQGSSFNPAQAGVGSMVLTYNTASYPSHLCPDQHSVAVNVYSLALPSISGPNAVCNSGAPFQISVNPIGGVFGGANTHAVNPEGIFIPALSGIGKNIINYSITSGPCVAYAQTTINVEKFISADFNVPQVGPFCQGEHKSLNMNSVVQNPGGIWQGTGMNNNMFNADQANVSIPNIITYQTHSEPTATLCPDMKTIQVRVNPEPKIEINSSTEKGCAPLEIIFNAPNTNQGQLQWVLGDNSENQNQTGLNVNHTYENPGAYHVSYIYTDVGTGCQSRGEVNNLIRVYEVPKADFYVPDEISIANPEVQLINQSNNVATNKFQWLLPGQEGDYSSNELNPEIYLPNPGDYRITLKATSLNGCKNELSKIITVKAELNIFIPDAFTPNYDGINDTFKPVFSPYGLDRNSYSMEIYDRWGKQLFQSKDPDAGWDGTVQNRGQEALKQDVYLFRLRVKNVEGILFQKTGTLQLIK